MSRAVALLAAVLVLAGVAGCGDDGAEPGVPKGALLVLDFLPNAVHTGIYTAAAEGLYEDEGVDLKVQPPGESTDAPKLLAAGKVEFAILDIHDLGLARQQGLDLVGVASIVQSPLAAVIARSDRGIASPKDLEGRTVGVTGLPSDEAVVDSELRADGGDPKAVKRVTIGFNAVSSLAAGKVDAATAFWNAEGVALREQGVPIRIFKVGDFGAPDYPELILTTSRKTLERDPDLVRAVVAATQQGYEAVVEDPEAGLDALLAADKSLDRAEQQAQLDVLLPDLEPAPLETGVLGPWAEWDTELGILKRENGEELDIDEAFAFDLQQ
ncbi:MAG TPA: ABC transporter substrate-binding protein [Solirubrobacterales bacterium]|nr:ABC transporter substrate-binding protein [Solirubrobacterales bacterium]